MNKICAVLMLAAIGCASIDGNYVVGPEDVRRVEPYSFWQIDRGTLVLQRWPGRFEMDVVVDGRRRAVPISCEQYDGVVRWGQKVIEIKNNRGVLQSSEDGWNWGPHSVHELFQ